MIRSTATIFSLLSTLIACTASAGEVAFNCSYQLGSEAEATRRKIGAVVIAIDVTTRTAKIDFGKGWFKTMSLAVDGTDLKETSPPASGEELGFFYFDLAAHSGGFSGGGKNREFFDGCVQTQVTDEASAAADMPAASAPNSLPNLETPPPVQIPDQAALPPPEAQTPPPEARKSESPTADKLASAPEASVATEPRQDVAPPSSVVSSPEAPATPLPTPNLAPALPPAPTQSENPLSASEATAAIEPKTPGTPELTPVPATHPNPPVVPSSPPAIAAAAPAEPVATRSTPDGQEKAPEPTVTAPPPPQQATTAPTAEPCRDGLNAEAHEAKVNFANASAFIAESSWVALKNIAAIAKTCESAEIEVSGHTDNFGDPADNKELSQQRAQAVVDFLVKEGVRASHLKAVGYGQERPIASNATMAGRRMNRRVEFHVSETKTAN